MKKKSSSEWRMHASLCGQITERCVRLVSNTAKLRVLEAIDGIEAELKAEWAAKQKAKPETQAESAGEAWEF